MDRADTLVGQPADGVEQGRSHLADSRELTFGVGRCVDTGDAEVGGPRSGRGSRRGVHRIQGAAAGRSRPSSTPSKRRGPSGVGGEYGLHVSSSEVERAAVHLGEREEPDGYRGDDAGPPLPPRSAQNRSGWDSAVTVRLPSGRRDDLDCLDMVGAEAVGACERAETSAQEIPGDADSPRRPAQSGEPVRGGSREDRLPRRARTDPGRAPAGIDLDVGERPDADRDPCCAPRGARRARNRER